MSDFKAKMHKIRLLLGITALPRTPVTVVKGPISKRRVGEEGGKGERKGRGKEEEGGRKEGRKGARPPNILA